MDTFALNLAYTLLLAATLMPTGLLLRVGLLVQNVAFVVAAILLENPTMAAWNTVFTAINLWQSFRLFQERRVTLADEEAGVRDRLFASLSARDFLALWSAGHETTAEAGRVLMTEGARQTNLHLVLDGEVEIVVGDVVVGTRGTDRFVGEFAFLNPAPATATVRTTGPVRLRSWSHADLRHLDELDPGAAQALRNVLSREVSRKAQEQRAEG